MEEKELLERISLARKAHDELALELEIVGQALDWLEAQITGGQDNSQEKE